MSETFEGRFKAWEDGRASITTSEGEIPVRDDEVLERLYCNVLATGVGDLPFDNNCVLKGERGPEGIHKVDLLVIKTEFIDIHVRGGSKTEHPPSGHSA